MNDTKNIYFPLKDFHMTSNHGRLMHPHKGTLTVTGWVPKPPLKLIGTLPVGDDPSRVTLLTTSPIQEIIKTPTSWLASTLNSTYTLAEEWPGLLDEIGFQNPDLFRDETQ